MSTKSLENEQKYTSMGLIAVVIWSFAALLACEITSIPPFEFLSCQFALAFLVTIVRYSLSNEKKTFFNFTKKDLVIAALTLIVNQACYYSAFRYSPAAQVDLINYLWPTLLILLSSLLPKEKFCIAYFFSCCVCMWGVYNLMPSEGLLDLSYDALFGLILAFMAAISWTLYSLYTRYHKSSSANCISCATGLAALFSIVLHLHNETFVVPSFFEMTIICIIGVIQTGLAFYFWESALKKGKVKFIGLSAYSIPVFSILILVVFGRAEFSNQIVTATLAISFAPILPLLKALLLKFREEKAVPAKEKISPLLQLEKKKYSYS